jgi:predicted DNA-binding transcriptional regulator AlpA
MELLTQRDIRARFSVSKTTFWRWRLQKVFPKPQAVIGRRQLWTVEQIERFIELGGRASR